MASWVRVMLYKLHIRGEKRLPDRASIAALRALEWRLRRPRGSARRARLDAAHISIGPRLLRLQWRRNWRRLAHDPAKFECQNSGEKEHSQKHGGELPK